MIVALFLSLWVQSAAIADGYSAADATARQGALFGIVQGCAMLWAPFFGWLADRINRITLVILATLLSIAGYGWMGLTPDPVANAATFGAAALLGIGQASGILASQVLIGQEAPGPIRGAVIGMVGFFGACGILLISKLGGIAFDAWRPGAPFIIMALANAILLVFAVYVRRVPRSARTRRWGSRERGGARPVRSLAEAGRRGRVVGCHAAVGRRAVTVRGIRGAVVRAAGCCGSRGKHRAEPGDPAPRVRHLSLRDDRRAAPAR